ncbi:hypothetical protein VaNZ11_009821 [Volvox africanus]|uniref:MAU2 chromatid cohesion factor homolog n=1 Tax=Volvox africanus TaxID=51714 RepID=A0ABQ5S966_9CHLO|nr:hypothetical protein VaNZ11_009821 [Volvox africanus]
MAELSPDALPNALALLATSYERDGCPIQTIHCLQALVNCQLPPDFEAKARMHLGRVLLEHTYNFREALSHLLRAQILAKSLIGNYCLKYEIQDRIATCYHYIGQDALELQAYTALSEPPKSIRNSSEGPIVCGWVCRLAQRAAALHASCGRHDQAVQVAKEGLAFTEANGLRDQKLVLLLVLLQIYLEQWDHAAVDSVLECLRAALADETSPAAAGGSCGVIGGEGALDPFLKSHLMLHMNLLKVLYMLRRGEVAKIVKGEQQQPPPPPPPPQQEQQAGGGGAAAAAAAAAAAPEPAGPSSPEQPPPGLLHTLEICMDQIKQQQKEQSPGQQQGVRAPYILSGLSSLEPLLCLVGAIALRNGSSRPRLIKKYLQRGLSCVSELTAASGIGPGTRESDLPMQCLEQAGVALRLQSLLLQCKAQVALSKAQLRVAREDLLTCQQMQECFPNMLSGLLAGTHLLTGQYCVATGEMHAAAAHFEFARLNAPSRPAAALAAVLEAEVHLSTPIQQHGEQQQQQEAQEGSGTPVVMGDVARALAALGPFYTVQSGSTPAASAGAAGGSMTGGAGGGAGSGGRGSLRGVLGHMEDVACKLASAACLAQQGELGTAFQLLSSVLKVALRRLDHHQLTCAILNHMALIYLRQQPQQGSRIDIHSATEMARSSLSLSQQERDLWAQNQAMRTMSCIAKLKGEDNQVGGKSTADQEQKITAAVMDALADSGRHGYAVGWGLRAMG